MNTQQNTPQTDSAADLQTEFPSRAALIAYLQTQFPETFARSPYIAETRGGRAAAEEQLQNIDPVTYALTRNKLDGKITRLSMYLRHGVLSLREVRLRALAKAGRNAEKLVNELAWRDYWQRVYSEIGSGIWHDREAYIKGWKADDYSDTMPEDVLDETTGAVCIDSFAHDLYHNGYLHNHARMWLAAYIVHWRRVRWQRGASWFLMHLLDGDPASNNLSWQWVASTFSHKPYIWNRDNLEKNTNGVYCTKCPLAREGCPFDASYAELEDDLFPNKPPDLDNAHGSGSQGNYCGKSSGKGNHSQRF